MTCADRSEKEALLGLCMVMFPLRLVCLVQVASVVFASTVLWAASATHNLADCDQ